MKFILFNVNEEQSKSVIVNKHEVLENKIIDEVIVSKNVLNNISNLKFKDKQNILDKIKINMFEFNFKRNIKEYIVNEDVRYILENSLNNTDKSIRYLISLIENLKIKKVHPLNEMDRNIFKYIEEYSIKQSLNRQDIKMLFVYKDINNIDLNIVKEAVKQYRKVNLYLKNGTSKELLEALDKINDNEGSVTEVIKYNKKAFIDYDVIYYADDYRANYPRMRLNKKSCIIDLEDGLRDKFNSNIIFFNKLENKRDIIGYIVSRYGLLQTAYALRQM